MASKKRTKTLVRFGSHRWSVPRGFGREFLRVAKLDRELQGAGLNDLIGLIGYTASEETLANMPLRDRVELSVYAANVHARASDNPIPAYPKPSWLPEPWCSIGGISFGPTLIERPSPRASESQGGDRG